MNEPVRNNLLKLEGANCAISWSDNPSYEKARDETRLGGSPFMYIQYNH
jgi:hypothetical protein